METGLRDLVGPAGTAVLTMELQRGVVGLDAVLPALAEAVAATGLLGRVGRLCGAARAAGARVVHCTVETRPDGAGSPTNSRAFALNARLRRERGRGPTDAGTPGAELMPELGPDERDVVVPRMHGMTPFTSTALDQVLRNLGVRTVVAAGVSLNLGVLGLVLSAHDLGYQVVLPRDAVLGLPADYADAVVAHSLRLVATVVTVDDVLAAWAGAGTTA